MEKCFIKISSAVYFYHMAQKIGERNYYELINPKAVIAYQDTVERIDSKLYYEGPCLTFWYFEFGECWAESAGKQHFFAENRLVLIPPFFRRRQVFKEGTKLTSLSILLNESTHGPILQGEVPFTFSEEENSALLPIARRIVQCYNPKKLSSSRAIDDSTLSIGTYLEIKSLLLDFLRHCIPLCEMKGWRLSGEAPRDVRIASLLRYIQENPSIRPFSERFLSELTKLSRVQIDRLMLEETGFTLKHFCSRICHQKAVQLLSDTHASIKEISARLCFKDSSHFCRWFRQKSGESPGRFRERRFHC